MIRVKILRFGDHARDILCLENFNVNSIYRMKWDEEMFLAVRGKKPIPIYHDTEILGSSADGELVLIIRRKGKKQKHKKINNIWYLEDCPVFNKKKKRWEKWIGDDEDNIISIKVCPHCKKEIDKLK